MPGAARFHYHGPADLAHLPGGDLVQKGLEDLERGRVTPESLLVSIASSRLRAAGLAIGERLADPEHRLYELLASSDPDSAHSRYNALLGRLTSFENAIECERSRMRSASR